MHPMLSIAIQAAEKAGRLIVRQMERIDQIRINEKIPHDFVTSVDQAAEKEIIPTISQAYPRHRFLAEESHSVLHDEPEYLWVIDPLDGTTNYIHSVPHFAVSIALRHRGEWACSVIYDPIKDELFSASQGQGAFLNKRRLRVSTVKKIGDALLGTGLPFKYPEMQETYIKGFSEILKNINGIRRAGAAALDLAYVAAGRFDGFWELALQPWDFAAGTLLVQEAGGYVTDIQGKKPGTQPSDIVAGNPAIYRSLTQTLRAVQQEEV